MKRIKEFRWGNLKNLRQSKYFVILVVGVIGVATLLVSSASTFSIALNVENGVLSGCVESIADSSATGSGNNVVRFGTGSKCTTPPQPPVSGEYGAQSLIFI